MHNSSNPVHLRRIELEQCIRDLVMPTSANQVDVSMYKTLLLLSRIHFALTSVVLYSRSRYSGGCACWRSGGRGALGLPRVRFAFALRMIHSSAVEARYHIWRRAERSVDCEDDRNISSRAPFQASNSRGRSPQISKRGLPLSSEPCARPCSSGSWLRGHGNPRRCSNLNH